MVRELIHPRDRESQGETSSQQTRLELAVTLAPDRVLSELAAYAAAIGLLVRSLREVS